MGLAPGWFECLAPVPAGGSKGVAEGVATGGLAREPLEYNRRGPRGSWAFQGFPHTNRVTSDTPCPTRPSTTPTPSGATQGQIPCRWLGLVDQSFDSQQPWPQRGS
jgi:hypothetical protein